MRQLALHAIISLGAAIAAGCSTLTVAVWLFYGSLTPDLSLLFIAGILVATRCYKALWVARRATSQAGRSSATALTD